jgi:hypothetical protein
MEPEGSVLCSQQTPNGPYLEANKPAYTPTPYNPYDDSLNFHRL